MQKPPPFLSILRLDESRSSAEISFVLLSSAEIEILNGSHTVEVSVGARKELLTLNPSLCFLYTFGEIWCFPVVFGTPSQGV